MIGFVFDDIVEPEESPESGFVLDGSFLNVQDYAVYVLGAVCGVMLICFVFIYVYCRRSDRYKGPTEAPEPEKDRRNR